MTTENHRHLERALKSIPWASQTNAKRYGHDDIEERPAFIKRAKGCRMWDLDEREYIDYRAALGPIILGYQYEPVDEAVRKQMELGTLFSMSSPLEAEAAEKILHTLGWADKIRFMKTGADACTCCVRLARSKTQRDHILTIGYHGYHDWFAFQWPKPGVPETLKQFVHEISYGDTEAIDQVFKDHGTELAAAITVPHEWHLNPDPSFIEHLRKKCTEYGTALIFDEVLTGFRLGKAGGVGFFGVTPDMAAYAKGIANGYPLSAYTGTDEWMSTLDQTIITTTYAGETLSLAAACAAMDVFESEPVHTHIQSMGKMLRQGFESIFKEASFPATTIGVDVGAVIDLSSAGEKAEELQRNLFNKLYTKGIFANDQWFITYSHQEADIVETLETMKTSVREVI
ncbi:MAG: aminotransferase class III-fold pyridoxal phosphate-dependent enzyme [Opitutales bacterium]|nr:aminotransferase class III-fold pyridoxal phosphate-dependent enzyme [Opitutales bacterium]